MKIKKFLSLFLSLAILCTITAGLDLTAFADTYSGTCGDSVTWSFDTDTGELTISGSGNMKDYGSSSSVPWYKYRTYISTVTIENGVTNIGGYVFYDCRSLTSITIPDGITTIGGFAFYECSSLTNIMIPESVTSIGNSAFSYCSSLESITIPGSVTSIGDFAFCNCTGLTSITIQNGITSIEGYVFTACTSLTAIVVSSNNEYYTSDDGVLFNKDKTEIICYPIAKANNTSYTVPDSVTSIWDDAFSFCTNLKSVIILDGVTSIGSVAFYVSGVTDVYYSGTEGDWNNITIGSNNTNSTKANIHYQTASDDYVISSETAATCTEDDVIVYTCPHNYTKTVKVPATGHTESEAVIENEVSATCTEDGSYDTVVYCSICK
ncbi:MAG: leucine-rich repeat domain-containing protein [Clostridiales bacterium]|nr:leucine-rich repeat domain-containing protein [Clostridiales bacterium]